MYVVATCWVAVLDNARSQIELKAEDLYDKEKIDLETIITED